MIRINVTKALRSESGQMQLQVELTVEQGQFVIVQGKSGAGKTSLLRMIAGLLAPDQGMISVGDTVWFDSSNRTLVKPQDRHIGYVFQEYALFPNMTVKENLLFAQNKTAGVKIDALLEMLELGNLQTRKPDALSGGQKQRVALARALVQRPSLLLLDEPLSALDHKMRNQLQEYLARVHQEFGLTTLMVSHDVTEALKLADKVVVLDEGAVVSEGLPGDLFGDARVSGKFQFTGTILAMERQEFLVILSILIGNKVVKVVADESEVDYGVGDKVLVASKAFNPIIKKIV